LQAHFLPILQILHDNYYDFDLDEFELIILSSEPKKYKLNDLSASLPVLVVTRHDQTNPYQLDLCFIQVIRDDMINVVQHPHRITICTSDAFSDSLDFTGPGESRLKCTVPPKNM
jgi:hypothetical protein